MYREERFGFDLPIHTAMTSFILIPVSIPLSVSLSVSVACCEEEYQPAVPRRRSNMRSLSGTRGAAVTAHLREGE